MAYLSLYSPGHADVFLLRVSFAVLLLPSVSVRVLPRARENTLVLVVVVRSKVLLEVAI